MRTQGTYREYIYSKPEPCNGISGRKLAERISDIVRKAPDIKDICDLGCGNGYLSGLLAGEGYKVTGIDASQTGIEIAKKYYASESALFIQAYIDQGLQDRMDEKFDLVVASDVIEHMYCPSELVKTAHCLLRPGGYLIISAPYHGYLKNLALSILHKWDAHHDVNKDGGHIKFFSARTLNNIVCDNAFEVGEMHFFGRFAFFWKNMIIVGRKMPG